MPILRSSLHWLHSLATLFVFYAFTTLYFITALPILILPRSFAWRVAHLWIDISIGIYKYIGGMTYEFRGLENLPPKGTGVIVAAKHQSSWETMGLVKQFRFPSYILKKQLLMLPLFGFYLRKFQMVSIDRTKGKQAMALMLPAAKSVLNNGRPLMIFPEGTRKLPGAAPDYKHGFARMYTELNAPIVPVALNTGIFWPKMSILRYPGKIIISILPAIPPGLSHEEAYEQTQKAIEEETQNILTETVENHPNLPTVKAYINLHLR